jgi:5-methylcytosine-specific restriction endonuclease McrA
MWPHCRELGVAAITYQPLRYEDLSQHPRGEPKHLWAQLAASQKASLRRVAYEMSEGDIIYVKQGPKIVGRGKVKGPYAFDYEYRLRSPHGEPWAHQVPVDWEPEFTPVNIKLGAEPTTVLPLSGDRLQELMDALVEQVPLVNLALPEEIPDAATLQEGARQRIAVNSYERNPEARRRCIAHYGSRCSVCGFSFTEKYGEIGRGVIHVHHLKPLSEIGEEYVVDPIQDLRPVCPNCHAIIHRRSPPFSIQEVRELIRCMGG